MAKESSSRLKLVPDKLMKLFTQQEDYFSSQETDDFFCFKKSSRKNNGFEKQGELVRIVWYSITMLLSGIDSHNCFSITLYRDIRLWFRQWSINKDLFSGSQYKLSYHFSRIEKKNKKGSLIYAEVQPEIKQTYCMYEAAYTVSALKKQQRIKRHCFCYRKWRLLKLSTHMNKKLVRTFVKTKILPYKLLEIGTLTSTGRQKFFDRRAKPLMSRIIVKASLKKWAKNQYGYRVCGVGFTSSRKLIGNVVIIAKIFTRTIWGKLLQRNLINFNDPLGFSKTVFIKTTYFEDDLAN